MNKVAAIILTCCLLFTLFGYHFIYRVRLAGIKSEMRAKLLAPGSKEVVTLVFDKEQKFKLDWEDDKEIRFEDEMYDVIDTITSGHQLIIRCISDKKEKDLLLAYQKLQDDAPSPIKTGLVKLMATYFIPATHYQVTVAFSNPPINYSQYTTSVCMATIAVPERPPCIS